jgi:CubicO group peptidase (beta-lactamase class C family)
MVHINFSAIMSAKMKFNCLNFRLIALFMLFLQTAFAQPKFPALDKIIEDRKKEFGEVYSVLLVNTDTTLYQKVVGDMLPKSPVPIGAASQWLTTALIMQLVDEGKLSLDDRVDSYLPVFASYRKGYITLRHCLTHQTGIGTEGFLKLASLFEKEKFSSLEDAVNSIVKKEIHANTGEQFRYSNYGPFIAARVVEVVTKKRFEQLIRTKLFVPMGLRNTSFVTDDGSSPNPSTGAKSTATDLAKFLQMLLNGGRVGGKQILSEAAVGELRKIQIRPDQVQGGVPPLMQGFGFALGSWAPEGYGQVGSAANVLVLPTFSGTWPLIDFSRRYAFVVLAKDFSGEQKPALYQAMKVLIDSQMPAVK